MSSNLVLQKKYPEALEKAMKAFRLDEVIGTKKSIAVDLELIAEIYFLQGEFQKAIHYLESSLAIAISIGSKEELHGIYFSLARKSH